MNWDEIWEKKGLTQINDLTILNGFDINNIKDNSINLVDKIINKCNININDSILEIGCGAGRLGKIFLEKNYNYYGLEKSSSLVDKFKNLVNKNKIKLFKKNDLEKYKNNSVDIIFLWSVLQYFENYEELNDLLEELCRIGKKYILIGDIYETYEDNSNKKYKYKSSNLKHLIISKQYFSNFFKTDLFNSFEFDNFYNSTKTRYNIIIKLNNELPSFKIIKNYFSKNMIENINIEIDKLENLKPTDIWKYYEDNNKNILSRLEYFINKSKFMKKLSQDLIKNKNLFLMKDKINFKYPLGDGFIEHQDISAGWHKYGKKHITIAIPLTITTIDNGCLWVADINCKKQLTKDFTNLNNSIVSNSLYKSTETNIGDIFMFDSFLPHKSFKNNTDKPRKILYFTYTDTDKYEIYHNDKFKVVPPDFYRDKNKKYKSNNTFDTS